MATSTRWDWEIIARDEGRRHFRLVVLDDWQRQGLGTLLMRRMGEIARARGLAGFTTDVSQKQQPMLMILYRNELHVESGLGDGAYHITLRFAPPPGKRARTRPRSGKR
ncbi:MAG: GNAT family N-acetyltransferase [Gemmatimonadetes bacterium]|nr:GNAT family N-acetyltransferase [Gemmatimonadota bacterium]